ncbi:MAG TPA: glycosyltransferase family 2 protein [Polyangiaceae bacterium]
MSPTAPEVSIVIPVYNEAALLRQALSELRERLAALALDYEIVLAENGSTDRTLERVYELEREWPELRSVTLPAPNYGRALRFGLEAARGRYVVCDEIDIGDTDFYARALDLLRREQADFVVGSKLAGGARDERPWLRHWLSLAYTGTLGLLVGFHGTDTHGLKAFQREALLPVVRACQVDRDVFASELVIRAERASLRIVEIPTRIREKRPPSINLIRRVPAVVTNLAKLTWVLGRR